MEDTSEFKFKYPLTQYRADDIYTLAPHETGENETLVRAMNRIGELETIGVYATYYDGKAAMERAKNLITAARALMGRKP